MHIFYKPMYGSINDSSEEEMDYIHTTLPVLAVEQAHSLKELTL